MAHFRGTVTAGGHPWPLEVEGGPAGRTIIRSGAAILLDENPFIARDSYTFRLGTSTAMLKWVQTGFAHECHIVGDAPVVLRRVTSAATPARPLTAREVARRNVRVFALVTIVIGLLFLFVNCGLKVGDRYNPTMLAFAPVMVLAGLAALVTPNLALGLQTTNRRSVMIVAALIAAVIASRMLFVGWWVGQ
ncbi:MAG: hypothetical protein JOZ54_20895 [Acidobacteria bacterium]|nr:hypothetical protein [Acidobacteriota bacterium]